MLLLHTKQREPCTSLLIPGAAIPRQMLAPVLATLETLSTLALLFGHPLTNDAAKLVVAEVVLHQILPQARSRLRVLVLLEMTHHLDLVVLLDRLELVDLAGQRKVCLHMIALLDVRKGLLKLGKDLREHGCRGVDARAWMLWRGCSGVDALAWMLGRGCCGVDARAWMLWRGCSGVDA